MKKTSISIILLLVITFVFNASLSFASSSTSQLITNGIDIPEGYEIVKTYSEAESNSFTLNSSEKDMPKINVKPQIINNNNTDQKIETSIIENNTKPVYDLRNLNTGEIVTEYTTSLVTQASTGTYSTDNTDSTLSVKAYGTLYYIYSGYSSEYVELDKINWRYEILDNSARIVNKTHYYEQNGASKRTHTAVTQTKTLYPTADSGTDLVRNWNWDAVDHLAGLWRYGIRMVATIGRINNSNTWQMEVLVWNGANI